MSGGGGGGGGGGGTNYELKAPTTSRFLIIWTWQLCNHVCPKNLKDGIQIVYKLYGEKATCLTQWHFEELLIYWIVNKAHLLNCYMLTFCMQNMI
jgi:hypothetical protein